MRVTDKEGFEIIRRRGGTAGGCIFFLSALLFLFLLTPGAYAQSLVCTDCHVSQHGGTPCPDCTTCHTNVVPGTNHHSGTCTGCHVNVVHPSPPVPGPCSSCHSIEATVPLNHPSVFGMPGNCQACHTVAGVAILPDKINTTCGSCHGGGTNPIDNPPSYGVFWRSEAFLAANAAGMHWIGSDLVISALSLSTSTTTPGGAISVTDSTKNRGGTPAGGSTTAFFLSSNSTCGDGDDVLLSPARSVPALDYNETSTGTTSVTIPGGTVPGTYYICAKADNGGVITEFDETNNTRISSALSVAGNDVDLVILSFSAPTSAKRGTNISIGDATRNRLAGTAGASTTAFYLSADTTLNGGDTLLGSRAVPSLAGGATSSGTTTVTIPAGTTAGAYYLIWKADNGGVITETDETNNTKYKAITITN